MTPQDKLRQPPQSDQISLDEWDELVRDRFQIPKGLWKSMSEQESGGDWGAVSPTGVKGKYQVTQATAKQYGLNRDDPFEQTLAAAKYLREQYDALKDQPEDNARWLGAVGRYYGGPGAVGGDGSISTKSPDGVSTPDKHIERVAKLWGQFEKGGEAPAPTDFSGKPVTPQPVKQQQEVQFQSPRPPVTAKRGPIRDVKPLGFGGDPTQQMMQDVAARSKQVKAVPRQPTDFEKRSPLGQAGEILTTGAMRGVEGLQKGLSYLNPMPSPYKGKGLLTPEAEQAMQQQEAAQDQAMPLAAPVARGLATAGVQAPAYMLGGAGGMGAGMLTAGGLSAAQEDWSKDPVRSAVRVGINATLPFAASRGANALIRPVTAPGVAATEAIAGAAGNVVPEGIEQMAFEGKLDPQRLAQTGLIGALSPLNVTGAGRQADANKLSRIQKATGSATTAPVGETPALTPDQAFGPDNFDPAATAPPPVDPQRPIQSRMQAIGTDTPATSGRYVPTPEVQKGVEVADKARSQAESARANQDAAAEVRSLEGERQAIKAAMRGVGMKDAVGRRALGERLAGIEQDIAKAKANARQSGRSTPEQPPAPEAARDIADDPTADLTGDLAPQPEQTAPLTEDLVQPTDALPEQPPADPRSGVATIYGRRAGTPLPPRVGETAPKRITKEIPRERTAAQESIRTAIDSAKARRMPPPPPKQAGVRPEVLGKPLRPIDPTTGEGQSLMYGARPHHQKRLNARGEEIKAEQRQLVEAGVLDEGNYRGDRKIKLGSDDAGKLASYLFQSNTPESIGGMSTKGELAFFHDPEVKGALGLTKDAGEKEIKDALNAELAGIMNVRDAEGRTPEGGITLRSVPVDVWKMWARRKALPAPAMAKFNRALRRLEGTLDDTTPPAAPDTAIPQRREAPMRSAQASDTGRPVARAAAETPAAPRTEPVADDAPARVAERAAEQPVTRAEQPAARASEPVAETPATPKSARKAAPRKAASPAKTAPKVNEKTLTDAGWQKKSPADYQHPDGRRISRNERNRWEITRESGEGTQTFDTLRDAIVSATGEPAAKPVKPSPMADDVLIKPQPEMPEDAKPLPPTSKPYNMPDPEPQPKRAAKPAEQPARVEKAKARRAAKPKAEAKWKPEQHIKIAADSPKKLRADDVYRLFEQTSESNHSALREYLAKVRPDLVSETDAVLAELRGDTPESKPEVVKPTPQEQKTVAKAAKGEKISERTGLTKTQEGYLQEKAADAVAQFAEGGTGKPITIKVPGDGQFTVEDIGQANNLHRRLTGQNAPTLPDTSWSGRVSTAKKAPILKSPGLKSNTPPDLLAYDRQPHPEVVEKLVNAYGSREAAARSLRTQMEVYGEDLTAAERNQMDAVLTALDEVPAAAPKVEVPAYRRGMPQKPKQKRTPKPTTQPEAAPAETGSLADTQAKRADLKARSPFAKAKAEDKAAIAAEKVPMTVTDALKALRDKAVSLSDESRILSSRAGDKITVGKEYVGKSLHAQALNQFINDVGSGIHPSTAYESAVQFAKDSVNKVNKGLEWQTRQSSSAIESSLLNALHRVRDAFGDVEQMNNHYKPRIVTEAEARLRDSASGKLAGSGAQAIADQAIVTGYKVYKQGMAFSDWTRSMLREFGGKVRPYLRDTWAKLTAAAKEFYRDEEGSAPASPGPPRRNRVTAAVRENAAKEPPRRSPYADLLNQINQDQLRQPQPAPKAGAKLTPDQKKARKEARKEAAEANKGNDMSAMRMLRTPLSNLNYTGTYERIGGQTGKEISEAIRNFQVSSTGKEGALAQLKKDLKPKISDLRDEGLPGLADRVEEHLEALNGKTKPFTAAANKLKGFQYNAKLRLNPRSTIINLAQPMQTLWPHLSSADMGSIYKEAILGGGWKRVHDQALQESGGKIEGIDASSKKGGFADKYLNWFGKSSELNRVIGHLAGERIADRLGVTGEAKKRMAADWAKKVEFDNSKFDIPPAFRGDAAGVLMQFKPFMVKNLERIAADWRQGVASVSDSAHIGGKKPNYVNGTLARRSKMVIGQLALGGLRSGIPGVPHLKALGGVFVLGTFAKMLEGVMGETAANKTAEALYFGLPGVVGQDWSGSVGIIDEPFGNSTWEKIGSFLLGPTISTAVKILDGAASALKAEDEEKRNAALIRTAKGVTPYTKTGEALYETAFKGERPAMRLGKTEEPMNTFETVGKFGMSTPMRQTKYYDDQDYKDIEKTKKMIKPITSQVGRLTVGERPAPLAGKPSGKPTRRRASRRRATRRESIG